MNIEYLKYFAELAKTAALTEKPAKALNNFPAGAQPAIKTSGGQSTVFRSSRKKDET